MKTKLLTILYLLLLGTTALQAQEWKVFQDTKGLYRYKDASGNVVIQPQYYHAYDFTQGMGAIQYEATHSYRK